MRDCPELRDIAHWVETGEGGPELAAHVGRCDACQEARDNFVDEATSLQISISELWFREQISCPAEATLDAYSRMGLEPDERAYVAFHLDMLQCPTCQGRLGESEVSRSDDARGRATRSRKHVADATVKLLGDLKKQR